MKKIIFTIIIMFSFQGLADDNDPANASKTDQEVRQYYNSIIEQYKKELSNVPAEVRKEIRDYRMAIAKINKQKRDLYKSLSIQAQEYLKREGSFRDKLPIEPKSPNDVLVREDVKAKQTNK